MLMSSALTYTVTLSFITAARLVEHALDLKVGFEYNGRSNELRLIFIFDASSFSVNSYNLALENQPFILPP